MVGRCSSGRHDAFQATVLSSATTGTATQQRHAGVRRVVYVYYTRPIHTPTPLVLSAHVEDAPSWAFLSNTFRFEMRLHVAGDPHHLRRTATDILVGFMTLSKLRHASLMTTDARTLTTHVNACACCSTAWRQHGSSKSRVFRPDPWPTHVEGNADVRLEGPHFFHGQPPLTCTHAR